MIPKDCKRLVEVDFPLSVVNDACVEENNRKTRVDSGHLSLLHSWWARRPLASCRSLLLTLLLPDPCDPLCPAEFKAAARKALQQHRKVGPKDADLQKALLAFVADIANWDIVRVAGYVSTARVLVKAAHGGVPHVLDPFSGGGSIPLEAQRLGCEVTASDINPVAWLLLKIALEWCGRKGPELADLFEEWAEWTLKEAENRLVEYYPADAHKRKPLAYLWARTVQCEAAGCGGRIPLVRNLGLSQSKGRKKALRIIYPKGSLEPRIEIFAPSNDKEVQHGTVAGNNATCPKCHVVTPRVRVQAQLREKRSGADDAMLLAVARQNTSGRGKDYSTPTPGDLKAFSEACAKAKDIRFEMAGFPQNDTRAFPPGPYGIKTWSDVLAPRQRLSRWVLHEVIEDALKEAGTKTKDKDLLDALAACLYAAYSDNAQYHTSLCVWLSEGVKSIFIQGSGVPMRADFVEGNPLSPNCEGLGYSIRSIQSALRNLSAVRYQPSSPLLANVLDAVLPEESVDVVFTDPPYANQIPYAHLSDFFYGWLRLGLRNRMPQAFTAPETEKARELTENRAVKDGGVHDRQWYESHMFEAFAQMKRVIREDGVASVVFAHKDTDRWEALVSALVQAGWRTTGSWPIATERRQRMRGQGYAALETSVHLVCRPRPDDAPVGDWGEVLRELPKRVGDWMERLQGEGIRGADLVFACIGPALEVFSRYRKVETADGREVKLAEYLVKVWEVVGRTALEQVLGTAEAKVRNGAAGALEEDARLTALFLWTLQATEPEDKDEPRDSAEEKASNEAEEEAAAKKIKSGHTLVFDVVRRFAQPLGIDLPKWEGRIIETEKGVVRLLPVSERAEQLFGEDGAEAVAHQLESDPAQALQQSLFPELDAELVPHIRGRKKGRIVGVSAAEPELKKDREATTLDRVHAAMLLQAGGQTNGLRALIKSEVERGSEFLRLANALSALYPKGSEEKRLLEAMLLTVPR
jgi:adenine-specific DNA methylase